MRYHVCWYDDTKVKVDESDNRAQATYMCDNLANIERDDNGKHYPYCVVDNTTHKVVYINTGGL